MANFSAENIYESKRWDMYVFLVCFVIINFFLVQKNIFFFNLIYNEVIQKSSILNFIIMISTDAICNIAYYLVSFIFYAPAQHFRMHILYTFFFFLFSIC